MARMKGGDMMGLTCSWRQEPPDFRPYCAATRPSLGMWLPESVANDATALLTWQVLEFLTRHYEPHLGACCSVCFFAMAQLSDLFQHLCHT
jgi:hypothetical protein